MVNEAKQKPPRRYEKMRDSGVAWIGMVPEGWNVTRIKRHFKITTGNGFRPDLQGKQNGDYPVCKASDIAAAGKTLTCSANYISTATQQAEHFNVIPKGSILIPKIGEAMKKNHRTIAVLDCCLDNNCQALTPTGISTVYAYYLFLCIDMNWVDNGGTIPCINNQQLKDLKIPLPEYVTQIQIVRYLDEKCRKIDDAIAEAKASVEEYKAWKASIIYEAVTKGLDPTAEMKDSGVEWIGKIPAHWAFGKIKQVAQFAPKCDFSRLKDDALITFTPMECIRNGYFENRGKQLNTITGSYTPYSEGDIVFAKVTPCFENGNICIMKNLYSGMGLGSSELFVLRAHFINTEYLFYYLQHPGFVQRACASMTGTGGLKRVSSDFVQNCPLPIPPEEEHHKIVDFLNRRCTAIEQLISDKNVLIEELESYKKSLIYEVVTGKRKVV